MKNLLTDFLSASKSRLNRRTEKALALARDHLPALRQSLAGLFQTVDPELARRRAKIAALEKELAAIRAQLANAYANLAASKRSASVLFTALGISDREIEGLSPSQVHVLCGQRVAAKASEQLMVMGCPLPEEKRQSN